MLKRFIFIVILLLLLTACSSKNDSALNPRGKDDLELTKLSTYGIFDQNASNEAKHFLSTYEEVAKVQAINDDEDVLIAVEVDHHERFNLDDIESKLRKKIKKHFSEITVTLSTDKKLFLEIEKVESRLENENVTNEQMKDKIKQLKKLSKEQT